MDISRYNKQLIPSFSKRLLEYLEDIHKISFQNDKQKQELQYYGFKTMIHCLCVLYAIHMEEDQINNYMEKAHILYNEYTSQVYSKNLDFLHSPSLFVHNVLLGNISLNEHIAKNPEVSSFGIRLSTWCELLFHWENPNLTMENRIHIAKHFLQSYILLFHLDENYESFRIFHHIQSLGLKQNMGFEKYSLLLSSFLNYFTNNSVNLNKTDVQELCYCKTMDQRDGFERNFEKISNMKEMDEFMNWMFTME